uniref:Uncharacterized protein n=1 Tax=Tanacetum cinerariifolium TaxID=118510 RepID=A0A699W5X1_TANCI|nr:hypothetical protein [Tanacetum cinerariifolium]
MSQLTITLDDNLLQAAQEYARQHGQKLDALVARLLADTVRPTASEPQQTETIEERLAMVRQLSGSVKLPADFDYRVVVAEELAKKYGI